MAGGASPRMLCGMGSKMSVGKDCFSVKNLQIIFSQVLKFLIEWPSQEEDPPHAQAALILQTVE